uniref:Uncharacterized protein n=1 Tax=Setaria viridis TaxID=4556 RepID=A0A4U6TMF4_SETVI|nr:hypothetical protein SEVIR_7G063901v2 [Setaria viridis]
MCTCYFIMPSYLLFIIWVLLGKPPSEPLRRKKSGKCHALTACFVRD